MQKYNEKIFNAEYIYKVLIFLNLRSYELKINNYYTLS